MNVCFISLGCDKNLVDSEVMLGLLRDAGYSLTNDEAEAEVIVINTCCFIHDAKQESIDTILEMAEYKKEGCLKALIVEGCLAERYRKEIEEQIPEVDAMVGTTGYDAIVPVIESVLSGKAQSVFREMDVLPLPDTKRVGTTGGYTAYLKIAEGCDKHCTYCAIPKMRGNYRSIPMERLIAEAEFLAEGGCRELILVAQETTLYGIDLYHKKSLVELIDRLAAISGISWIRLLYCYPEEITDELIERMKRGEKLCHYLDIPIQHASDQILRAMGRRTNRAELEKLITKLRCEIPDIVLRTTLITGFPGETEEDHEDLKDFVKKMRFDRLGVFSYSKEEGTPAAKRKDQILKRVKEKRQKELMRIQQQIAFENAKKMIGQVFDVMVE
ncbi:MAG: 30S ribosomal protein S12 methylthiotransferase RimO [Lachnospiraceae bacterium]|nr:30S ribosomal protein S12 methylthiotransferase RimO [Lachnospiraceae bacterium]